MQALRTRGSGLIEYKQPWLAKDGTCEAQQLSLANAQVSAVLRYFRVDGELRGTEVCQQQCSCDVVIIVQVEGAAHQTAMDKQRGRGNKSKHMAERGARRRTRGCIVWCQRTTPALVE